MLIVGGSFSSYPPSEPIVERQPLAVGRTIVSIEARALDFFFRHEVSARVVTDRFASLDIKARTGAGHMSVESTDSFQLPIYRSDTLTIEAMDATEVFPASIELRDVVLHRRSLPGGWLLCAMLTSAILYFGWLAWRPPSGELLKKQAIAWCSGLVSVVLIGLGLQVLKPGSAGQEAWHLFQPNLTREFEILPNITPGIPAGRVLFRTNSEGIRARERTREQWGSVLSVLCIGASTTEGLYLGEERHWPRLLEKRLVDLVEQDVWVGNAGRSGYGTGRLALVASNYLPRIRPKYTVLLTGFNEGLVPDVTPRERRGRETARRALRVTNALRSVVLLRLLNDLLFDRVGRSPNDIELIGDTYSYRAAREALREKARKSPPRDRSWQNLDLAGFEANLRAIHASTQRVGSKLVMLTQPTIYREDLGAEERRMLWMGGNHTVRSKRERMDVVNARILSVAAELGVPVVDLEASMPRTLNVFYDDVHFNVHGAERVADEVFRYLKAELGRGDSP